ncbi:heme ABC transporter permease [Sulfurifustis variabilis]|uniref:Heme ABC transporter permease n=1 Tax=Sulfurifustis variabilis TaxID=1675686 RepID=A0A1B4V9C9_9GAMM|nr:DUF2231 domain-containing protein [Sulfurifustis variabilis]BAU49262.1 heme ABC transporter permease [Sulfurifustis variabilis]
MGAYHAMLVHFPLALWTTAALVIAIRAVSDGTFARAADRVLAPLLLLGAFMGLAAYVVGLLVWPFEAMTSSPLGRNHLLLGTWTLAYWALLWVTRARLGEAVWDGVNRWIMLGLAALGAGLLTITGTLGGHLVGNPTAVSQVLRALGWEVYRTFYLPTFVLVLLVVAAIGFVALGWWGRAERAVPGGEASAASRAAARSPERTGRKVAA